MLQQQDVPIIITETPPDKHPILDKNNQFRFLRLHFEIIVIFSGLLSYISIDFQWGPDMWLDVH